VQTIVVAFSNQLNSVTDLTVIYVKQSNISKQSNLTKYSLPLAYTIMLLQRNMQLSYTKSTLQLTI
jgi:hypothetical protein